MSQGFAGLDLQANADTSIDVSGGEAEIVELVVFSLGGNRFALPGRCVREVLGDEPVFFVPGCPAHIEGVINLRGGVESVLMIDSVVGVGAVSSVEGKPQSQMLLIEGAGIRTAIRVDRVLDVRGIEQRALEDPPDTLPESLGGIAIHVFSSAEDAVVVLDCEALLGRFLSARSA